MKRLIILEMILMSFIWSPMVSANIYTWTDESNVQHFTNQVPPPGAKIFIRDLDPKPAYSPEPSDKIEKNNYTTENQNLEDRLSDTQERLSETLEKVNSLEDKIRHENAGDAGAIEPEENANSESIDNSSYSEPEDTPAHRTYYYPVDIFRHSHLKNKYHHQSRRSYHRSHKGGYYYKKQKNGKHHRQKSYYKKRHHKKHKLRNHRYKKHRYENQHRRNRYFGSSHKRRNHLSIHHNRLNLKLN